MKVFISVPMHGRSEQEVQDALNSAKIALRSRFNGTDVTFLDQTIKIDSSGKNEGLEGLGEAIKKMADADLVYCCESGDSKGCAVERYVARTYRIPMLLEGYEEYGVYQPL